MSEFVQIRIRLCSIAFLLTLEYCNRREIVVNEFKYEAGALNKEEHTPEWRCSDKHMKKTNTDHGVVVCASGSDGFYTDRLEIRKGIYEQQVNTQCIALVHRTLPAYDAVLNPIHSGWLAGTASHYFSKEMGVSLTIYLLLASPLMLDQYYGHSHIFQFLPHLHNSRVKDNEGWCLSTDSGDDFSNKCTAAYGKF